MGKRASKHAAASAPTVAARMPWELAVLLAVCVLALVSTLGAQQQFDAVDGAAITLGVAALVGALALVARPLTLVPRDRLGLAWSAFLAWALIATLASGRVWAALMGEVTSLLGWFTLVALTVIAAAAARFGGRARKALEFAAPIIVFGEVAATVVELALGDMPRGSLPNSTYLGEALLVLLPFVMAEDDGVLKLERRHRLWLAGAAAITLAAAGSRVAAVVAIGWFLWVIVSRSGLARSIKLAAAAATLIAVAAGALTFARAEVLGSAGVETLGLRPQMWRTALLAAGEAPVLGYGPDGFVAGGVAVTTPELAREGGALVFRPGSVDPHNLVIWVLVSTGVVGLALFVWVLVELCVRWWSRWREGIDVAPGVFSVLGPIAVFLTAPAALQVLPLFAFAIGVALSPDEPVGEPAVDTRPAVRGLGWALVAGAAVVCAALTANATTRLTLEQHSAEISPAKVAWADSAMRLWPLDAHLAHLASLHWGWVAAADPAVASRQPDLAAIDRAYRLDRRDPFVAFERARTLRFYGAPPADIEAAFLAAFERWELYPLARAEYAVFLAQAGRDDEAREQIAIATLVDDTDPQRDKAVEEARSLMGDTP